MEQIDFTKFSKEELIELLKVHNRLTLTLDGLWFTAAEKKHGLSAAIELDTIAWEGYGFREARRLKKFLSVEKPTLSDVGKMLLFWSMRVLITLQSSSLASPRQGIPLSIYTNTNMTPNPNKNLIFVYVDISEIPLLWPNTQRL